MGVGNELCLDENVNEIANVHGVDLLKFAGSKSFTLLENIVITAGDYSPLRLKMVDGSYAVLSSDESKVIIKVPSKELKLDGFTAVIGGTLNLTVEFDLRKSMTNPVGLDHYFLKPRGVRLVDDSESATISGSVDADSLCALNASEIGG